MRRMIRIALIGALRFQTRRRLRSDLGHIGSCARQQESGFVAPRSDGSEDAIGDFRELLTPLHGLFLSSVGVSEHRSLMIGFAEEISERSTQRQVAPAAK